MSPYAAELLRWLLDPPRDEPGPYPDSARLSDEDIATLLPAALRSTIPRVGFLGYTIRELTGERQARFTAEACSDTLRAVADQAVRGTCDPEMAVYVLRRTTDPWPGDAGKICSWLLKEYVRTRSRVERLDAVLALAAVAGEKPPRIYRAASPLVEAEREVLSWLGPQAYVLVADLASRNPLDDTLARLAAYADYQAFAQQALSDARVRAERIQAGEIAYAADKAFTHEEVKTLGRAARTILVLDQPGAPEILGAIAQAVCVAPTAAKTLPSQALLFEIARSTEDAPTPETLAVLRTARASVRHKGAVKQLDRMLKRIERALAARPGVALRLPDLGFDADGTRVVDIAGHTATATATGDVSVPSAVRKAYPEEVKELRGLARQAKAQVQTLAAVLEAGLAQAVSMPMSRWRTELAAGGLGRYAAARLIWVSGGVAALGDDVTGDEPIRLWHPLTASAAEVESWRAVLAERRIRQPFKQAYRETYPLTPAERDSGRHSLRFAGHVVRNRQLYALLKARGWQSPLLGPWDSGREADAQRVFGDWRITLALAYLAEEGGVELAETGRVCFSVRSGGWIPAPLADVPPLVFSEAMRDVDLFVAAASIAYDPEWTPERFGYWHDTGFGELSATAAVRREALERLLPRLRIASRCTLTDRFLVVRGDRFTYRIHLGSANILIEPSGSYLCIVAARSPEAGSVFLPFEDDKLGLVLSKAFLLADDARISDPSILRQLPS